jgi:hypothetical protein
MINLIRPLEVPKSLHSQSILTYLDALAAYRADPDMNPEPRPPIGYRNLDIISVFEFCFFSKCYLTERKYEDAWSLEIDHVVPVQEAEELRYEWTNLLPISSEANKMRPKSTPIGGYLDPCKLEDDVEHEIIYMLDLEGELIRFVARDETNLKAKNTAALLDRLHNGHDAATRETVKTLKILIQRQYLKVLKEIVQYNHASSIDEKLLAKEKIKLFLSRQSSFTMLLRSCPVIKLLPPDFLID